MQLFDILAILCIVSMTGTEFTVSAILNPALDRLDPATWMKTMPVLARAMGRVMPFWYALGLLFIGVEEYLRYTTPSRWWIAAAILLWIAGIVYSITMLVPINNRIAVTKADALAATTADHRRWDSLHRWRVLLLVAATTCLLIGIV